MANNKINTKKLCYSGLFTAVIVICSWISIPFAVPFTLQIFAVAFASYFLGGYAYLSYISYLLLGVCGVPVFSGFNAGLGYMLGATGGFLLGMILLITVIVVTKDFAKNFFAKLGCGVLGLVLCYIVGVIWFVFIYLKGGVNSIVFAIKTCVAPFVLIDIIKISLAIYLYDRICKKIV